MELTTRYSPYLTDSIEVVIGNCILFGKKNNRSEYINSFVSRLKYIPQVVYNHRQKATYAVRNRLTHVQNMAQILDRIVAAYPVTGRQEVNRIYDAILVHDIGHPPFGHAGERALDAILQSRGASFSNSTQSERLLVHAAAGAAIPFGETIFQTAPYTDAFYFKEVNQEDIRSVVVNFLDDLENCIGDLMDLWYTFDCPKSVRLLADIPGFSMDGSVPAIAMRYIKSYLPTGDFTDLCHAILTDHHTIGSTIAAIREDICQIISGNSFIRHHDEMGFQLVQQLFFALEEKLCHVWDAPARDCSILVADMVSSLN